jgi:hypothetical protein
VLLTVITLPTTSHHNGDGRPQNYISLAKPAEASKGNMNALKRYPLPMYDIFAVETAVYLFSGEEDKVILKFLL